MMFSSSEGKEVLDQQFGQDRTSAFIHVFELLLMLENFCKTSIHKLSSIKTIKKGMPKVLNTIKNTINREEGNGMKIIKFHLVTHFAEDILRFGSMNNYDSCIGERHHSSEIKDPAKLTQRRKRTFEYQTGVRYFEQRCITMAANELKSSQEHFPNIESFYENKNNNIIFNDTTQKFMKMNSKMKKYVECSWVDRNLQTRLTETCKKLLENGYCTAPLKFFTQHNRDNLIFRGDPQYDNTGPWYDWANVKWDEDDPVPAKILLFIDLEHNFKSEFQIGDSIITYPGSYAIAYTFLSAPKEKGHQISRLVDYGKIMLDENNEPELCFFSVDCIHSPCVAVPYNTGDSIADSQEWLVLKPRHDWYNCFLNTTK
jgi:hypothetical protein